MPAHDLSDAQWCLLDLLMRARAQGIDRLNRLEVLNSPTLPREASLKLVMAALRMPTEIVTWHGRHDFSITEAGVQLFNLMFGKGSAPAVPTRVADVVICLPGPEGYRQ